MRRIFCLILALLLSLGLFACGSGKNNTDDNSKPSKSDSAAPKDEKDSLEEKYKEAQALMLEKKYDEAIAIFESLGVYNGSENMVKECKYLKGAQFLAAKEYETAYNIFSQIKSYKDTADILGKFVWKYTEKKKVSAFGADLATTETYTYDERGYTLTSKYHSSFSTTEYTHTNEFDANGRLVKVTEISPQGFQQVTTYEYNEKGLVSHRKTVFNSSFNDESYYTYNDRGLCVQEEMVGSGSMGYYTYDEHGNLLSKKFDDNILVTFENTYNDAGMLTKCIRTDNGTPSTFEYTYDEWGNLTQEVVTSDDGGATETITYSGDLCFYQP